MAYNSFVYSATLARVQNHLRPPGQSTGSTQLFGGAGFSSPAGAFPVPQPTVERVRVFFFVIAWQITQWNAKLIFLVAGHSPKSLLTLERPT